MAHPRAEELRQDVEELKQMLASAQRQRVKDILLIDIRKLESEMIVLREQAEQKGETLTSPVAAPAKPRCYDVKINNYAWDQSDKFVKIFVTLKNVQTLNQSNVFCNFTKRSVELHVQGLDDRNYHLPIMSLLEDIDVEKSYWKVKTDMVVVFLMKSKVGSHWTHMTLPEKKAKEPKLPKMDTGDTDPSASLMNMMKQMYEDGDDEMKRTIAKAWTESREKQMAGGEF
ncbi:calcyclin-binding protein [Anabrus simplex]|uniref:calcyclin-binding protein n=1 Tax=Anabrus simplex TaxID=316456 RepID=UPI0034DCC619